MNSTDYDNAGFYSFIGYVCEVLDLSRVKYHHCCTWFKLFLKDDVYSVVTTNDSGKNEVVVCKGFGARTKTSTIFQGTLQEFENWLQNCQ